MIHAQQLIHAARIDLIGAKVEHNKGTLHPDREETDGVYLREGLDYYTGEEQRLSQLEEIHAWFKHKASQAHYEVMTNPQYDKEERETSSLLKEATEYFLSPSIQKNLEILSLLKDSDLTFKQKDDFLQLFANDPSLQASGMENQVLNNVIHPHWITQDLFGETFYSFLANDRVEYTKFFTDGSDSHVKHEHEALQSKNPKESHDLMMENRMLVAPRIDSSLIATACDQVQHYKMMRLLEDYYGIVLNTDRGMMVADTLIHNYDISPGEHTLDRSQAIPMPEHTFDELPIMKFDGWEDSDTPPPADTFESTMDLSVVESSLTNFLQHLSESTGQEITLSSYKANNKLSDYQYKVLRSVLHLESSDITRLKVLEKIWGTVLPQSELDRLFQDKYAQLNSENHH